MYDFIYSPDFNSLSTDVSAVNVSKLTFFEGNMPILVSINCDEFDMKVHYYILCVMSTEF